MTWKPIVAGIDNSVEGAHAGSVALDLARAAGTKCYLVHAVKDPLTQLGFAEAPFDVQDQSQKVLDSARTLLTHTVKNDIPAAALDRLVIRLGSPAVVVPAVADEHDAEMIVLGGKHHSALGRWLAGSTVHHLVRVHDRPLLVAGPTREGRPTGFKRILAAVDLSAAARPTIDGAERLAGLYGAKLRLLHVIEPLPIFPDYPVNLDEEVMLRSEEELARSVWPQVQFPGTERLVRRGPAAETIAAAAEEWQADLVVVATHGRGWVDRVLIGSVTERLLNRLPTSMLVMPVTTPTARPRPRVRTTTRAKSSTGRSRGRN
jgi:nucleotide-binding universal stress UspA family protein